MEAAFKKLLFSMNLNTVFVWMRGKKIKNKKFKNLHIHMWGGAFTKIITVTWQFIAVILF